MLLKEAHALLTQATKDRIAAIARLTGDPEAHWLDVVDQVEAVTLDPRAAVDAISSCLTETWAMQAEILNMLAAAQAADRARRL